MHSDVTLLELSNIIPTQTVMKTFTTALIAIACFNVSLGQGNDTLTIERNAKGQIACATFRPNSRWHVSQGEQFLRSILQAVAADEFRLIDNRQDKFGITHNTYQHFYAGYKVDGSGYNVHGKGDAIWAINGTFDRVKLKESVPALSESAALQFALSYLSADKYLWQDKKCEEDLKLKTGNPQATNYPKGELVITKNWSTLEQDWRIAWKFQITSISPFDSQNICVDAVNGKIVNKSSQLCNINNSPGTAETFYSGVKSIITDQITGGYQLEESRNGVTIATKDLHQNEYTFYPYSPDFVDLDNNWTAQELNTPSQNNQVALDVHWALETVLDYFRTVHGWNGIDNNGMPVQAFVHMVYNGSSYQSFWWAYGHNILAFGDGNSEHNPLTTLDIVAHEFAHGINDNTSHLGEDRETGALNEGLSDIWGAIIEQWAAPQKDHWSIGEETGKTGPLPIRSLSDPLHFKPSEPFPDTYGIAPWQDITNCTIPDQYNDYCGIHKNATVFGKWFYLLSDGGSDSNGNGSCYNVQGIGIDDAAAIVYQAQHYHMSYTSDYSGARNAMILASNDIYGPASTQTTSVKNAWFAVGVGQAADYSPDDINGTVVCAAGVNVTLNNSTDYVSWVASPASLFVTSSGTGHVAFLQAKTSKVSGPATISFTQLGGCTGSTNSVSKTLWVGKPQNNISGPSSVYGDAIYTYTASDPYTSNYMWTLNPGVGDCGITYGGNCFFGSGGGGQSFTIVYLIESGYVQLNSSNGCGSGPQKNYYVTVTGGGCNPCMLAAAYPNPSSTELNVRLKHSGKLEPTEIKLIDENQVTLYSNVVTNDHVTIQTSQLHEGVYYLVVSNKSGKETKRILIGRGN